MIHDAPGKRPWLALMIGNSRLHWAAFEGDRLTHTWKSPYLTNEAIAQVIHHADESAQRLEVIGAPSGVSLTPVPLLVMASVVPAQAARWQVYPQRRVVTLDDIPLGGLYPTLGIDRALAVWGAIQRWGAPVLVVDAGTALTLTATDDQPQLMGGAILPGVQLQMRSLAQDTAALPMLTPAAIATLPPRWATTTPEAIQSGILYTLVAGLRDFLSEWLQRFPQGAIALTGGDGALLYALLTHQQPEWAGHITLDPDLLFRGLPALL